MPETYGLSASRDGCEPCDCNAGGAVDNHCDVITGQCTCRPNMQGRRCEEPKQHHYVPSLHNIYEAEVFPTECEVDSSYGVRSFITFRSNQAISLSFSISNDHNQIKKELNWIYRSRSLSPELYDCIA